jgi:hypothetical protein
LETKNRVGELESPVISPVFGMTIAILRVTAGARNNLICAVLVPGFNRDRHFCGESEHECPERTHIKPPAPFQGQTSGAHFQTFFPYTRARIHP